MRMTRSNREAGLARLEVAITVPMVLLIGIGIFEFGRAYQTWQVVTNAAREGARVAVVKGSTDAEVESAVRRYMRAGHLPNAATAPVVLDRRVQAGEATESQVIVRYPFEFIVLNPAAHLVTPDSTTGAPLTVSAVATMRNES